MKIGDRVKVREDRLDSFLTAFAAKIRDREGIIESFQNSAYADVDPGGGAPVRYVQVRFLQRNGRGKEFTERLYPKDLVMLLPATGEGDPS